MTQAGNAGELISDYNRFVRTWNHCTELGLFCIAVLQWRQSRTILDGGLRYILILKYSLHFPSAQSTVRPRNGLICNFESSFVDALFSSTKHISPTNYPTSSL